MYVYHPHLTQWTDGAQKLNWGNRSIDVRDTVLLFSVQIGGVDISSEELGGAGNKSTRESASYL